MRPLPQFRMVALAIAPTGRGDVLPRPPEVPATTLSGVFAEAKRGAKP
jgi:hypothetical protein